MKPMYLGGLAAVYMIGAWLDGILGLVSPNVSSVFGSLPESVQEISTASGLSALLKVGGLIGDVVAVIRDVVFWNFNFFSYSLFQPIQWILRGITLIAVSWASVSLLAGAVGRRF